MLDLMQGNLSALGVSEPLGTVLADAGYWSEGNATGEHSQRYDLLIATRNRHKQCQIERERGASEGPLRSTASPRERMEERLQGDAGKKLYAKRGVIVEPPFGHIKEVRRGRRFMRRGLKACNSEWTLMATAHNMCKLHVHRAGGTRKASGAPVSRRSSERFRQARFNRSTLSCRFSGVTRRHNMRSRYRLLDKVNTERIVRRLRLGEEFREQSGRNDRRPYGF
jgi:hypothetical protein